ncbi:hypothetical protein GobsT_70190 [Gemmata obscuriglobus]|uniref:Uncharacterized protein n=1 Tax=Gemmata obscuriglobus TaxID=114 RepID=A0A2Z3HJ60_9BACT|nr:hypothetical protein [Gemmata obscuriglobus]AWM41864.1 hypothetical protein C1280_35980 [Gemmata obscuriglobus]QEG32167.1 hypothetical protein GobsT_70190 [Gemmata obscuriglobus]VTS11520.1 Uncharacterized protein OS=Cystobacter violaceus Cb vi76 GN=Q664_20160 PE=4 SV=1 [Gemmata obscuriglobus UQM 2246]
MLPPAADRPKLRATLDQLSIAVEELLLGGLTTASDATRQTLAGAMQEAARMRLLRLGGTLRVATDELGRFTRQEKTFSRRRFTFFLNRAWLLSRGMIHALDASDEKEYDRLTWAPPSQPLPAVEVVNLGVVKKVAENAFAMFEFRLRAVADAGPIKAGQKVSWSTVFPLKKDQDIPPEGFLHLPQKQKFSPFLFLERTSLNVTNAAVSGDEVGGWKLSLTDQSTVTVGKPFAQWDRYLQWSAPAAAERLAKHAAGPLDLDTELQEEVVIRDYDIGKPGDGDEPGQTVYELTAGRLKLHAVVGANPEGKALRAAFEEVRKAKVPNPPLFGVMHYERCRLVLQPLTTFAGGPDYITISKENVNKAALLKAMNFTS